MNYSYKKLEKKDSKLFKKLIKLFGEVFNEPETYLYKEASQNYLEKILVNPNTIVIVSTDGNNVIGGLVAYVLEKFEQERKEVYIYDLGVLEEYRRKKVATNLILNLKEYSKQIGAYIIFVQADYGDDPAIKLYESLGIREEVLHFDIKVD